MYIEHMQPLLHQHHLLRSLPLHSLQRNFMRQTIRSMPLPATRQP
jgi:hypothetical protein